MNHDSDHQPDQQAPRFMIIAQARSGSTFLREVLNAQPDITCHGEVFSRIWIDRLHPRPDIAPLDADQIRALLPLRDADPLAFMAKHIMAFPGSATGFKIIYDDFIDARFRDKLTAHALENDFEIIHLRRNNHLAAFVSRARMTRFGIGHSDRPQRRAEAEPPTRITVDEAELKRYITRQAFLADQVDQLFPDALQVRYETLRDDFPRILSRLGLPGGREFAGPLRKMAPENLAEVIENYDQLRQYDSPSQPLW